MLRRMKDDVLTDLPPVTHQTIPVDVSPSCLRELDKALKLAGIDRNVSPRVTDRKLRKLERAAIVGGPREQKAYERALGVNEQNDALEAVIREVSETRSGVLFETLSKARVNLARAKAKAALQIVSEYEQAETPLLVFSAHQEPVREIGSRDGWAIITAETSPEERTRIEEAFQRGEHKGVALTIKAGGVAITLTRASTALYVDEDWTPGWNRQSRDRIRRIGQKSACHYIHLVARHCVDYALENVLTAKEETERDTVDAAAGDDHVDLDAPAVRTVEAVARVGGDEPIDLGLDLGPEDPDAARRERERERQEARTRELRRPTASQLAQTDRRQARTEAEEWAANGLARLALLDPDRALVENDAGFNKPDSNWGHRLAALIADHGGLTNDEWREARARLRKYHRQIGLPS
jgi:superfamily II DNA or RNA helicase